MVAIRSKMRMPLKPLPEIQRKWQTLPILGMTAFGGGLALAVASGIWWPQAKYAVVILALMGLTVGLLNITAREIVPFLIAAGVLVLVGYSGVLGSLSVVNGRLGGDVDNIARHVALFMAPAAVVAALRATFDTAMPGERETDKGD